MDCVFGRRGQLGMLHYTSGTRADQECALWPGQRPLDPAFRLGLQSLYRGIFGIFLQRKIPRDPGDYHNVHFYLDNCGNREAIGFGTSEILICAARAYACRSGLRASRWAWKSARRPRDTRREES